VDGTVEGPIQGGSVMLKSGAPLVSFTLVPSL